MNDFTTDASRNGSTSMSSKRVMPPTASFVCKRAEDKVTGHGRANRDVRGLDVANFADHHDVRVLSQNVTQTWAKVKSISGFTSICKTPASLYSTGSSIVMMRRCTELIVLRKQ